MISKKYFFVFISLIGVSISIYMYSLIRVNKNFDFCSEFDKNVLIMPIDLEFNEKKSDLNIEIYSKHYDAYLFKENRFDGGEDVNEFINFFSYFIKGEYEAVYKKTFKGEFSGLEEVKKHVNLFNDTFDGYKNLKLISQVCMGEQREFLWSIELNGKEYVRSFRFSKKGKGSLEYLIKNTSISISPLLRKVYQFSLNDEVLESSGNISHPVLDEDGSFPFMILLGDGRKFNYRISDINSIDETKFLNKAVKAYLTIYSFLLEKRKKDFLMYLTKNSSKKAKEWLFSMSHDVYNSYLMSLKKRKVYYSINAYPYVIIFYEEVMQGSNEKVFRHEYLVKDDNSEYGFLLTNFYYEDFLDDVFNSKEKFIMGLKEIQ